MVFIKNFYPLKTKKFLNKQCRCKQLQTTTLTIVSASHQNITKPNKTENCIFLRTEKLEKIHKKLRVNQNVIQNLFFRIRISAWNLMTKSYALDIEGIHQIW